MSTYMNVMMLHHNSMNKTCGIKQKLDHMMLGYRLTTNYLLIHMTLNLMRNRYLLSTHLPSHTLSQLNDEVHIKLEYRDNKDRVFIWLLLETISQPSTIIANL